MSADFWSSSQRLKWQFTRPALLEARRRVLLLERKMIQNGLIKDYANVNYDIHMRIYLHNLLIKLGRRLNVRQVALASAEVYMIRFLTRVLVKEINVYVLVTACLYVACKIEECPQHIRLIISEARNLWPEYIPHDVTKLAEFEFYLIEEMDSYLFLHHPYKSLLQTKEFLIENPIYGFTLSDDELQNTWSLINDSYITDLHLLVPPHIIAIAALYITIVLKKHIGNKEMQIEDLMTLANKDTKDEDTVKINKFMNFLDHSHVNLDEVVEAMQDMINVYVVWNRYNEQGVKKALQGMLLARS